MILKMDMKKAYDRVNWDFLAQILAAFGFSRCWIDMVIRTVNANHFSILVNGELCGYFKSEHGLGLRQGDPLSSTLFILSAEFLSRGLNVMFENNPNMFYETKNGVHVNYLSYVDDIIVFCKGLKPVLQFFLAFIKQYERVSGQKMSMEKSNAIVEKGGNKDRIQLITGFCLQDLPITYLGAPISIGRKKIVVFNPLLKKIRAKFAGWNIKMISQGGRLLIINSVLFAMPLYIIQVINPLIDVLKEIDKIFSRFFKVLVKKVQEGRFTGQNGYLFATLYTGKWLRD